jgi:hypothetical protein
MPNSKRKKLLRRQRRKYKLHYWRRRLAKSEDLRERERIIAKIRQLSLHAPIADYLAAQHH